MSWVQIGQNINGENAGDRSGESVSINSDGSRIAIGAAVNDDNGNNSGHVRIYEYDGSIWKQLGQDIDGENENDESGISVSIDSNGNRVAIGAPFNNDNGYISGHTRIYEFDGSMWIQLGQDIDGENLYNESGASVSISGDGNRVAIGSIFNDGDGGGPGQIRVFEFDGSSWIKLGNNIIGENNGDQSGTSVSINLDGSIVAIGARNNDGNGNQSGHVRIYEYNGLAWNQLGQDIDGENAGDQSGTYISLSGDGTRITISALLNDDNGFFSGHTRIFEYDGSVWNQLGQDIDGENELDRSGWSVSLSNDGTRVAIGEPFTNIIDRVRVFEYDGSVWNQIGQDIISDDRDSFGRSLSINANGNRVVIGDVLADINGVNSGTVRIFELRPITCSDADETEQILLNISEQNLSIIGQCPKIPTIQYQSQKSIEDINYFKFVKIQLNDEIAIYNTNTLEEIQNESSDIEIYIENNNSNNLLKEVKMVQIDKDINGSFIKSLERFILLRILNEKFIKINLSKNSNIVPCVNSILVVNINNDIINTIQFA